MIAAAEITYNDKTHKPLAESMCHLAVGKRTMNDTDTRVVMTASKRMLEDGTAEPTLFDFVNVLTEVRTEAVCCNNQQKINIVPPTPIPF